MSKLPAISGEDAVRAFEKAGYVLDHQTGSHMILRQTQEPQRRLSIPDHRELAKGVLRALIRASNHSPKMATLPLASCPYCDYRLEGLPVEHRCPECGRAVNRQWQVFNTRAFWQYLSLPMRCLWVAFLAFTAAYLVWSAAYRLPTFRADKWIRAITVTVSTGYVTYCLFARRRWFVAVAEDGVSVCRRDECRWEHYPLEEISRAYAGVLGRLWVQIGETRRQLGTGMTMAPSEAKRCAAYINLLINAAPGSSGLQRLDGQHESAR